MCYHALVKKKKLKKKQRKKISEPANAPNGGAQPDLSVLMVLIENLQKTIENLTKRLEKYETKKNSHLRGVMKKSA